MPPIHCVSQGNGDDKNIHPSRRTEPDIKNVGHSFPAPTINNHGGKVNWRLAYEREAVALDYFMSVPAITSPSELPLSAYWSAVGTKRFFRPLAGRPLLEAMRTWRELGTMSANDP